VPTELRLDWLGWSTFLLTPRRGPRVLFDPCVTSLAGFRSARPDRLDADVVILTHGHHEHLRDVHRILRRLDVPVLAPPQVASFLVRRRGIAASRVSVMQPDSPLTLPGLTVLPRAFPHLQKHDVAGKLANLRRDNPVGALAMMGRELPAYVGGWLVIRDQPEEGPFLACDLRWDKGPRALITSEAFTALLDGAEVDRWREGPDIDLAVVGVESGQEASAAALSQRLGAKRLAAAAVHAPFERFYGKPAVRPDAFLGGREDWRFLRPGDRLTVP
jgi:hypothetical protein